MMDQCASAACTLPFRGRLPLPMTAPLWSAALARAIERNAPSPAARYLQLATVRPDGRPAVRTVVFRGLRPHPGRDDGGSSGDASTSTATPSPALAMVTDGRTSKVAHLAANPAVEAAWYFPDTREQFRLGGRVTAVGEGCPDPALAAARADVWAGLSPGVREWHVCPAPGSDRVRGADSERMRGAGGRGGGAGPAAQVAADGAGRPAGSAAPSPSPSSRPHAHFTLLLLDIDSVDHVDLVADTRHVWERAASGDWTGREVWP